MNIEIIEKPLTISVYGFSGTAFNKDYAGTAFRLSSKMWEAVKGNGLKNKGINKWIYESGDLVFAGVELDETPPESIGLEHKTITLTKYGYYKHIGSYKLLGRAGLNMNAELNNGGYNPGLPYIEIYGHWNNDETKLETELLVSLV